MPPTFLDFFAYLIAGIFIFNGVQGTKNSLSEYNSQPVRRLIQNANHLHKRQTEQLPLSQSQYFSSPYQPEFVDQPTNQQFPNSLDEEERFFLTQETTSLNPLSFYSVPTSTINPIQQQLANEQRRFQQEIVSKNLREQQRLSLGLGPPPTTRRPPPQPIPDTSYDPSETYDPASDPSLIQSQNNAQYYPSAYEQYQQPPYSYVRQYRSVNKKRFRRAIDLQLTGIENDVNDDSNPPHYSTPSYTRSGPRRELARLSSWFLENLARQMEYNLASRISSVTKSRNYNLYDPRASYKSAEVQSTRSPSYSTTPNSYDDLKIFDHSSPETSTSREKQQSSFNLLDQKSNYQPSGHSYNPTLSPNQHYQSTTQVPTNLIKNENHQPTSDYYKSSYQSTTEQPLGNYYTTASQQTYNFPQTVPNWNNVQSATSLMQTDFENIDSTTRQKIKNIEILSTPSPNLQLPYDNFQAYKQIYNLDHFNPVSSTTPVVIIQYPQNSQISTPDVSASISSLFKSKLNNLKESDSDFRQLTNFNLPSSTTQRSTSEFQQQNRYIEQLLNNNSSASDQYYTSPIGRSSESQVSSNNAIFIKVPETSTVGYIFEKPIPAKSGIHKKENFGHKSKKNRSPQEITSSLVYRTPPGKKASNSDYSSTQIEDRPLFSNVLANDDAKPPFAKLLENTQTPVGNSFLSSLLKLAQA